jgi:long-chain acyl-CoA synthetase
MDNHGHLKITDRKKDIIVNSGGDNIAPQRIEGFLDLQPEIAQSMVYGDKKPNIVALIVPHPDFASDWATANGKKMDMAALVEDADFRKAIAAAVDKVNTDMSVIERVRKFILTAEGFTTENEMMTPSMKIRRHVIRKNYGDALEGLYAR